MPPLFKDICFAMGLTIAFMAAVVLGWGAMDLLRAATR
jgi:hypothetical protein